MLHYCKRNTVDELINFLLWMCGVGARMTSELLFHQMYSFKNVTRQPLLRLSPGVAPSFSNHNKSFESGTQYCITLTALNEKVPI